MYRPSHLTTIGLLWAALAGAAQAQGVAAPPSGVLSLGASATIEVPKDVLAVSFTASRDGADAQGVQGALKQALDAALAEARKSAKPGALEVQTGNFSIFPRYSQPNKGAPMVISGWQGTAEMQVQGKDITAIAQLTGRIQSMSVARVGYSLSREAREKVEGEAVAQAIARWRAKAALMSQQFGYSSIAVREVNVATNEMQGPSPVAMRASRAMSASDEALPTEAGKADVTATVNGSVQMIR